MHIRILGSAAGGGVPQWNCPCANCAAARAGAHVKPRSQSSVAVSADGQAWFLLNASPDVRSQIAAAPALGPNEPKGRSTGIVGCVLTDAELDHTAGLLLLREGTTPAVICTNTVRCWLNRYLPIEPLLASFSGPPWYELPLDAPLDLPLRDGNPSGLRVRPFEVDPHFPRYVKEEGGLAVGSVIGLEVEDTRTSGRIVYAPCVSSLGTSLRRAAETAAAVLIDGTFWDDDEPIRCGIGSRTARAMGHLPVSGPEGSLQWLSGLRAGHQIYVHINNTNPMLNERGPEYQQVTSRGVRVGEDGDYFEL